VIIATVIILSLMILSIVFFVVFFSNAMYQYQQKHWPQTSATILNNEIQAKWYNRQPKTAMQYYVALREFKYEVDGKVYSQKEFSSPDVKVNAKILTQKTPIGSEVTIYYDPNNPENSTMVPGIKKSTYYYLGVSLCCIAGACLIFVLILIYTFS